MAFKDGDIVRIRRGKQLDFEGSEGRVSHVESDGLLIVYVFEDARYMTVSEDMIESPFQPDVYRSMMDGWNDLAYRQWDEVVLLAVRDVMKEPEHRRVDRIDQWGELFEDAIASGVSDLTDEESDDD